MRARVKDIKPQVLRQCREQAGLSHADVEKKIKYIVDIEKGRRHPTFKQLDTLSDLYNVPRWVFISDDLPEEYQFNKTGIAFRQFARDRADLFSHSKIRILVAKVERLRDLILELREEIDEIIEPFDPPVLGNDVSLVTAAIKIRQWLNEDGSLDFSQWREKIEAKNIFVFITSKYRGWSHIDKDLFRGFAIYHPILPVIIINDSDAKKAQSLTLFHELGHLIRRESALDDWNNKGQQIEDWCDKLAGNVLMPADSVLAITRDLDIKDLNNVKGIAKKFEASVHACLVRLRQLNIISYDLNKKIEIQRVEEVEKIKRQLQERETGPSRNISAEVQNQYGRIYTNAVFQAYHNREIGLHKVCQLLGLKQASHALKLEQKL